MKINELTAYDYSQAGERLDLVLGCTVDEALAFDASRIEVETDAGDLVEAFAGYAVKSATVDAQTKRVTLSLVYDADGIGAGINALAAENAKLKAQVSDQQAQIEDQASAIEELGTMAASTDVQDQLDEQASAIEELAALVASDSKEEANG